MQTAIEGVDSHTDEEVVRSVLAGETSRFEILMRRHNRRVYRAARAILRDEAEAEDATQDAYVRAYEHLHQFAGRASFSTWLTRIVVNESLARARRRARNEEIDAMDDARKDRIRVLTTQATPETQTSTAELRRLLESAIDALPDSYRHVFVLRDVEEMSTQEAAECLGISEDNVKMRLHRARAQLRRELFSLVGAKSTSAFQFQGERCDRIVAAVMKRVRELHSAH